MRRITIYVILLLIASSCELKTHKDVDAKEFNKGKEAMKIKRYTEDQIFNAAYQHGDSLLTSLRNKIDLTADNLCTFSDLKSELSSPLIINAGIRCQRAQTYHPKEAALWDAYQKITIDNDKNYQNTIQRLGDIKNYQELVAVYPIPHTTESGTTVYLLSIVLSKREVVKML